MRPLKLLAWTAMVAVIAAPVLDALLSAQSTTLGLVGRVAGALGNGLLVVVIVLGLRSPLLERALGPLDRLVRMHHRVGVAAYVAILIHPLALAAAAGSWSTGARLLFSLDRAVVLGWIALLLLVLVVGSSFVSRLRHETWRRIHSLGWAVAGAGVVHAALARGPRASDAVLAAGLIGAGVLEALSHVLYRARYRVADLRRVAPEILEVDLEPLGRPISFAPAQFVFVRFRDPRRDWKCLEPHPFTIASNPREGRLQILIKGAGDCTRRLLGIERGAIADVHGPFGGLFSRAPTGRQVWLAGGLGIAPFLSAIRSLDDAAPRPPHVDVFYCTKRASDAVYLPKLQGLTARHPSLHVHHHVDEDEGLLTADRVLSDTESWRDAEFFIAGPPSFVGALSEGLKARRVEPARIHYERFEHI